MGHSAIKKSFDHQLKHGHLADFFFFFALICIILSYHFVPTESVNIFFVVVPINKNVKSVDAVAGAFFEAFFEARVAADVGRVLLGGGAAFEGALTSLKILAEIRKHF